MMSSIYIHNRIHPPLRVPVHGTGSEGSVEQLMVGHAIYRHAKFYLRALLL